jgi:tRNA U34 5-methylaminomethyl-2-thiouridine-forming methyltransferase MnmC
MKRILKITGDGSPTIYLPELDEHYHSVHGAVQEAKHVFIKNGLSEFKHKQSIQILEIGFGTGLNALLTCLESINNPNLQINYKGIESDPLSLNELNSIDYSHQIDNELTAEIYSKIISCEWEKETSLLKNFRLTKINTRLQEMDELPNHFDLIYYDAFGPRAQEEMWDASCFHPLYNSLKSGGLLVTYCAQGQFKRNLKQIGFRVEARQGPPGKREMTLAWKNF